MPQTPQNPQNIRFTTREAPLPPEIGTFAYAKQVHGTEVRWVSSPGCVGEADALITTQKGLWLGVKTADCLPVLVQGKHHVAAIHAGRRGLQGGIVYQTLLALRACGETAQSLHIHIGPHIRQQNYEVPQALAEQFGSQFVQDNRNGGFQLNLAALARAQIEGAFPAQGGGQSISITDSGADTFDAIDTNTGKRLYFSYRRGDAAPWQRQWSFVRL